MISDKDELTAYIEDALCGFLPNSDPASLILEKAESYSLEAGGKRLRPLILLAVCEMLRGRKEDALPFAIALEFIHTYSLIHDDLPAMDNDDMRRGRPSNHKAFGEDIAILAGDALLTRAAVIMSDAVQKSADKSDASKAMNAIMTAAYDMVRGQVSDIKAGEDPSLEYLEYVHKNKTSALFRAAFAAGAYIADADEETCEDMINMGTQFGMAFQLLDDILDYETDECLNLAQILGIDKAKELLASHMRSLKETLSKYENKEIIEEIISIGDI